MENNELFHEQHLEVVCTKTELPPGVWLELKLMWREARRGSDFALVSGSGSGLRLMKLQTFPLNIQNSHFKISDVMVKGEKYLILQNCVLAT